MSGIYHWYSNQMFNREKQHIKNRVSTLEETFNFELLHSTLEMNLSDEIIELEIFHTPRAWNSSEMPVEQKRREKYPKGWD